MWTKAKKNINAAPVDELDKEYHLRWFGTYMED